MAGMTARTHDQIYQAWRGLEPKVSWREHLAESNNQLLKRYEELGFWTIPLANKSKRPISGFDWDGKQATWLFLFSNLSSGGNLGVVAGLSKPKLVLLDYDEEVLPQPIRFATKETLTSVSPNGYHIFTVGRYDEKLFERLKERYPKFDLARAGHGYCVVPPSMTCKDEHSKHPCEEQKQPHKYRMHEWIDINAPLMKFSEFVKRCI